jgi:glutamate synthase domain-containing protein 3
MDKGFLHEEQKPSNPSLAIINNEVVTINAAGMNYRDLNSLLKSYSKSTKRIDIYNVHGQRYIGAGLRSNVEIRIYGTPGNDLAAFMDGPTIYVHGNAQDGIGNTMNSGKVVIYGHAGDVVGYAMRGGKIFIRDDVGYRAGVHMKGYGDQRPIIVIGGTAQDFLGEYMAGGILIVLGLTLKNGESHKARFVGTGMHGGVIYVRGQVAHVGKEVKIMELEESDMALLRPVIEEFCNFFGFDINEILAEEFKKLVPVSTRPYGKLYV